LRHSANIVGNEIARDRIDKNFIEKLSVFIIGKGIFIYIVGGIDDAEGKSQAIGY
jgi:hypothetical protein